MITQEQLMNAERKVYSQHGEDGVSELILNTIGHGSKTFIEIGCGDTSECNCRYLKEHMGYAGVFVDSIASAAVVNIHVTIEVERQLREAGVPTTPDVLSLDIDGNDWHILKNLGAYLPTRMLIVEVNPAWPPHECKVMPYDPNHYNDGGFYFGASQMAFHKLANQLGYSFVYIEGHRREWGGVNAFFVAKEFAHRFEGADSESIYHQKTWPSDHPLTIGRWQPRMSAFFNPYE